MEPKVLRRYENTLVMTGAGTVMLGVWSALKAVADVLLRSDVWSEIRREMGGEHVLLTQALFLFFILIAVILVMTPYVLVGRAAVAEGKGKRKAKGNLYLVIAVLMVLISVLSVVSDIRMMSELTPEMFGEVVEGLVRIFIEATSLILLLEMIVAGFKVKAFRKQEAQEET